MCTQNLNGRLFQLHNAAEHDNLAETLQLQLYLYQDHHGQTVQSNATNISSHDLHIGLNTYMVSIVAVN